MPVRGQIAFSKQDAGEAKQGAPAAVWPYIQGPGEGSSSNPHARDPHHQDFVFSELFESQQEDPSTLTARKMDWESFMTTQNDRCQAIIVCLAEGGTLKSVARRFGLSCATILYHKERLTKSIKEFFGQDVLALVMKQPEWKSNLRAMREKHAHQVKAI